MSPILKRQKEKYKMPSKYVLLILTSLCVLLMVITFMTNFMGGALNTISGYVVVPFQEGISEVGSFLTKKSEDLKELRTVMVENEKLKAEIEELTSENIKLRQDKYELESLRKLFKLDADYAEYEKTAARIISKDTGNWYSSFIVNKGSNDGIKLNMNVIADGGLVGIVTKVGDNWSRVTAVIDDTSNVSAMALSTNDNLIVSGNIDLMYENRIAFSQLLDNDNSVKLGDKIVTSNISDKYLPGILIGYVTEVKMDANHLSKSGQIIPVVDFEHLSEVLIIMELKQTID